jgi:hypothetical protein
MQYFILVLAVFFTCFTSTAFSIEADDEAFKREAAVRWKQIQKYQEKYDFHVKQTEHYQKNDVRRVENLLWHRRDGCLSFELTTFEKDNTTFRGMSYDNYNPRYEFVVRKMKNENQWTLLQFFAKTKNEKSPHIIISSLLVYQYAIYPNTHIVNTTGIQADELIFDPTFSIQKVVRGENTIVVDFRFQDRLFEKPLKWLDGQMELDVKNNWAIRKYRMTDGKTTSIECEIEPASSQADELLPKSIVCSYYPTPESRVPRLVRKAEFTSINPTKRTERDFTLTAFGLPEPPGEPQSQGYALWSYLVLAALLSALLTGMFWWFSRRKRDTN